MLGGVNVGFRALGEADADESETDRKCDRQIKAFPLHDSFLLVSRHAEK
jgi:hypothetical protein